MVDDIGDILLKPVSNANNNDSEVGTIRKVDKTGRIVITSDIRRKLGIENKDLIEMNVKDGTIILRKHGIGCVFCDSIEDVSGYKGKKICYNCLMALTNKALRKVDERNSKKYVI